MSIAQQYCLRWNNHSSNFVTVFGQLLKAEAFTDVTIAVDGGNSMKCHKMVLAACSSYFQELFIKNPCEHPILILSEVKFAEIRAILDYMYRGEVNVAQDQLAGLLKVASFLKVKGLVEDTESNNRQEMEAPMSPQPTISTSATSHAAHSSGYISPPPHIPSPSFIPYGKSPISQAASLPLYGFPGLLIPQHPISGHQPPPRGTQHSILGSSYENPSDISPLSRKKQHASSHLINHRGDTPILRNVLGGQADSSQHQDRQDNSYCSNSNGSIHDSDRRNSSEHSEAMADDDEKPITPNKYAKHKNGTDAKPEWKRYKQYTRQHIQDAMAAVDRKEMSALQAASKFGIPSRTLYDKLKKAGILPTRGAGVKRESICGVSARFPYSNSLNGSIYGSSNNTSLISESESDSSAIIVPGITDSTNGLHIRREEDTSMDITTHSPSTSPMHHIINNGHGRLKVEEQIEDQVEDLSVSSRRTDVGVIVPPAVIVKEEEQHEE